MHMKTYIHYSTKDLLAIYKVCLCFLLLYITSTVCYGCLIFMGIKFLWILLGFLSVIIYTNKENWEGKNYLLQNYLAI